DRRGVLDLGGVLAREQRAVKEDLPDELGLLPLRLGLLGEAPPELALRAVHQAPAQRRALLERPDRAPERPLHLFALLVDQALQRERVPDVAAEVLENPRLGLGEDALTDRADQLGRLPALLPLELLDESAGTLDLAGLGVDERHEDGGQLQRMDDVV